MNNLEVGKKYKDIYCAEILILEIDINRVKIQWESSRGVHTEYVELEELLDNLKGEI